MPWLLGCNGFLLALAFRVDEWWRKRRLLFRRRGRKDLHAALRSGSLGGGRRELQNRFACYDEGMSDVFMEIKKRQQKLSLNVSIFCGELKNGLL